MGEAPRRWSGLTVGWPLCWTRKKEESRFIPKNSQQLNRNRTCAENRNNWPTIEQQPTNKRTNIPTDPKKKQHINEKKKTDNISRRRTAPFLSISTTTSAVMKKKKQANAWAGRVIFPFPFFVSRLSLFSRFQEQQPRI